MKYTFTYRTPDNVIHEGVIAASSREDVYRRLRPRGIKPYNIVRAPGLLNWLCLPGKRGWSIIVLCALCLALCAVALRYSREAESTRHDLLAQGKTDPARGPAAPGATSPRHQIPSLPANWLAQAPRYLTASTDQYFARYAQPGHLPDDRADALHPAQGTSVIATSFGSDLERPVLPAPNDPAWVVELKRIVAGMKEEALALRRAGKSDAEISLWLSERQRMEVDYRSRIVEQVRTRDLTPAEANRMLSAMGLAPLEK